MKNLTIKESNNINGGCFAYYAGWFLHVTASSFTGIPDGEDIANLSMHYSSCDDNDNCG